MTKMEPVQAAKKPLPWLAPTLILTIAGLLFLAVAALYYFGSVSSALAYLSGDRLLADRRSESFGEVDQGQRLTIRFALANTSRREIRVLGAKTRCTCVFAEDLPLSVPPTGRRAIKIAVNTDSLIGPIRQPIFLYTDFPGQSKVELLVVGRVRASGARPRGPGAGEVAIHGQSSANCCDSK